MKIRLNILVGSVVIISCLIFANCGLSAREGNNTNEVFASSKIVSIDSLTINNTKIDSTRIAFGFDFPVGKPDAKGYYNAQGFTKNRHLGDDWNGVNGGNTDLNDPIYSIGNGYVSYADDYGGGWGNTVRIVHELPNGASYESVYTHCDTLLVKAERWVLKGEQIGTIGTAHGQYYAHLHLEIRSEIRLPIGNGYSIDTTGYVNPTTFINTHRILGN